MRLIIIFALVCAATGAAYGQLDQSEEATTKAFGKPIGSSTSSSTKIKTVHYRTDSHTITAGFKDGKGVYFIYKKNSGTSWTDAEVKSVLDGHRLGNSDWGWSKDSGNNGPAVHTGSVTHVSAAQQWHIFGHDDYSAAYYPEKKLLLIWEVSGGIDAQQILDDML